MPGMCPGVTPGVVREGGVEPPHPFGYSDLNAARLPIPPLARDQPILLRVVYEIRQECDPGGASPLYASLKSGERDPHPLLVMGAPVRNPCAERAHDP